MHPALDTTLRSHTATAPTTVPLRPRVDEEPVLGIPLALTDYGVPVELLDGATKRRISGLLSDERAAA